MNRVTSNCVKILLTSIVFEKFFQPNTLLLPISTMFETTGEFFNLEGRCQQTRVINKPKLNQVREIKQFGKIFHDLVNNNKQQLDLKEISKKYVINVKNKKKFNDYSLFMTLRESNQVYLKNIFSIIKNQLVQPTVVNFYKTNLAAENSVVMSECSTQFVNTFCTFHFYKN